MDLFSLDASAMLGFLLIFMRVSVVVFMLPFFGGENNPAVVKAFLSMVLTMALYSHVPPMAELLPGHPLGMILLFAGEILLGLALSLVIQFLFAGIQTGGQVLSFQMGFSMLTFADPLTGATVPVTSHILYMVAMLIFLGCNGHLIMLHGFADSFALAPPGTILLSVPAFEELLYMSGGMFVLAIKIAGPVMGALFLMEVALGLMSRAAPQMHLITIGMPLKIGVGFLFIGMLFSVMGVFIEDFIRGIIPAFRNLMQAMGGG